ncbi:hypothetical protein ACWEJP_20400 [Streptomyces sp. NPDC004749]
MFMVFIRDRGLKLLKIKGLAPCDGSTAEIDPWASLKVSWHVNRDVQPLYLMITGASGGYVELKVHPESGALMSLTVIDLPVEMDNVASETPVKVHDSFVPVLDVTEWVDRDQLPPEKRVVRVEGDLAYSRSPGEFVLRFAGDRPESSVRCGPAVVEIAEGGVLATLVATVK